MRREEAYEAVANVLRDRIDGHIETMDGESILFMTCVSSWVFVVDELTVTASHADAGKKHQKLAEFTLQGNTCDSISHMIRSLPSRVVDCRNCIIKH